MEIKDRIDSLNWETIANDMNDKGYAHISNTLTEKECEELVSQYNDVSLYRKTINMERYRFGLGEYKYYQYPLPVLIQELRQNVYPGLAAIANNWMRVLNIDKTFPD